MAGRIIAMMLVVGEPEPVDTSAVPVEPEPASAAAPVGSVPGFPPEVDLWNEATWADLTAEQKDELRAERARRVARGEQAPAAPVTMDDAAPLAPAPNTRPRDTEPAFATRSRLDLREYWEEKHMRLVGATTGFAVTWGVGLAGTLGVSLAGRSSPGPGVIAGTVLLGVVTLVGIVGTSISGAMLGAHNNARPLYFGFGGRGLALRF